MNITKEVKQISLEDLIGKKMNVTLTEYNSVSGNVSFYELLVISALVNKHQPEKIFEIGTFDGRTTMNMALNCKGTVYTLDLPMGHPTALKVAETEMGYVNKPHSGDRFLKSNLNIVQIYADSASYDYSQFKNQIDFMFIDGSHTYDYVKKDTETALEIVKPGGCILWHDYAIGDWDGVIRRLNELSKEKRFENLRNIENTSLGIWYKI